MAVWTVAPSGASTPTVASDDPDASPLSVEPQPSSHGGTRRFLFFGRVAALSFTLVVGVGVARVDARRLVETRSVAWLGAVLDGLGFVDAGDSGVVVVVALRRAERLGAGVVVIGIDGVG